MTWPATLASIVRFLFAVPIVVAALVAIVVIVACGWLMGDDDDAYGGDW